MAQCSASLSLNKDASKNISQFYKVLNCQELDDETDSMLEYYNQHVKDFTSSNFYNRRGRKDRNRTIECFNDPITTYGQGWNVNPAYMTPAHLSNFRPGYTEGTGFNPFSSHYKMRESAYNILAPNAMNHRWRY